MKRPTTYVQWRKCFHETCIQIGFIWESRWSHTGRITIDRLLWTYLHRAVRLKRRLEAEFEAMDSTCADALLKLIFKD